MYRVEKKDGKILVWDANDKCVYSASETSYIIHRANRESNIQVSIIRDLTDYQLLTALANSVKLPE